MEAAPLTLAHTHARNAVLETRKANPVAASEEHDLAAGEFATAAQNSSDREALRALQLLEQHHKKLAQILRFQHEHPHTAAPTGSNAQMLAMESGTRASMSTPDSQQQPPRLSGNPRLPSRETSTIASNLASARGIPSQPRRSSPASPTITAQQAGAKMTEGPAKIRTSEVRLRGAQMQGMKERANRSSVSKQPWSPPPAASPTDITAQQYAPAEPSEPSRHKSRAPLTEEPFQKFYSTFEGLISKISAPLAFAGLPLGTDTSDSTSRKTRADTKTDRYNAVSDRASHSSDPDIKKIFSRAALQAIKDTTGGTTGSTAESFYVVPTTGGTVSYAGILTRAEKEARRKSFEDGDEDFVDARETPSSPEMRQSLSGAQGKAGRSGDKFNSLQNPKTMEELQMENQALRHLSDTLSTRLHMWEVNAQSSSMALQQSLKAMHHQNPHSSDHAPQLSSAIASPIAGRSSSSPPPEDPRIKELEEIIRRSEKELSKVGRENDKLRDVLGRYRERWEKLKEGAKTRRAEGRSNSTASATPSLARKPSTQVDTEDMQSRAEGENESDKNVNESEGVSER